MSVIRIRCAGPADAVSFQDIAGNGATVALLDGTTARSLIAETPTGESVGILEAHIAGDDCEVIMLATRADMRRRGIANRLLENLVAASVTENITRIILDVAADNTAAIQLYTVNNFVEIARRPGYYRSGRSGKPCDALLLERQLSHANAIQDSARPD